jgi:hypothetical protein
MVVAEVTFIPVVWNENPAFAKFEPVTVKLGMTVLKSADFLLNDLMTGNGRTEKLADVAVAARTVMEIGPVVAPLGTDTTRVFCVAVTTVAVVPLNWTVFAPVVEPKPWP